MEINIKKRQVKNWDKNLGKNWKKPKIFDDFFTDLFWIRRIWRSEHFPDNSAYLVGSNKPALCRSYTDSPRTLYINILDLPARINC